MTRTKKVFVRLGLVLLSLIASVFAVEGWIRAFDPLGVSYYRDLRLYMFGARDLVLENGILPPDGCLAKHKPMLDMEFHTFRFMTNNLGLRAGSPNEVVPIREEARESKAWDKYRILFMGDSITLAWGVNDEDSWVRRIENSGRHADGKPLECLNAGNMQYDTVQSAALLHSLVDEVKPDLVVLNFYINDFKPTYSASLLDPTKRPKPPKRSALRKLLNRLKASFFDHFYGISGITSQRKVADGIHRFKDREYTLEQTAYYPQNWPRCEAALDRILEDSPKLVIFDHTQPKIPELVSWCEENDVPYIWLEFSNDEWWSGIHNSVADSHFNAKGNRLAAEKALKGLTEVGILSD